jgi:regulator of nonsense transcripts 1
VIQGPPGTGKTTTLCAIIAHWAKKSDEKILICAPSNPAADLIAEQLQKIPYLQEKFVRYYSEKKEDIFNFNPTSLKPYVLQSKIFYLPEEL